MDSTTETKALTLLRDAKREADESARLAMSEAAQLISLSNDITQRIRQLTETPKR